MPNVIAENHCISCGRFAEEHVRYIDRAGNVICVDCLEILKLCAFCGSTTYMGDKNGEQLHFDELCFK